jgi:HlyD family secretion protein
MLAVAGGAAFWWWKRPNSNDKELTLYGNVDLRQVMLAFNNSERISAVLVQEGDKVSPGQLVAKLDTSRLEPQVAQVQAQVEAQKQVVERLHNGSRPEEIAQARAMLESAKADATNARRHYDRVRKLAGPQAVSEEDLENARAAMDVANAKVVNNQKALDLLVIGPRKEDIAQAEAQLRGYEAQFKFLQRQLADAQLIVPQPPDDRFTTPNLANSQPVVPSYVVRTRLMEPGEMASPQKPVFSLAMTSPKWIRAYVSEPDLGKLHPGMAASIMVDSFPNRRFDGWVGFISPVAEFTPKTVQTSELRTSLVYEVRVFVNDPSDDLRLGMPATVFLSLTPSGEP